MPITSGRYLPLFRCEVWNPGEADPVVTDRGFAWYDVLAESGPYGSSDLGPGRQPRCEVLEGVGLALRPRRLRTETRLADWSAVPGNQGTWEERRSETGAPQVYRLWQIDTTADLSWGIRSNGALPASPEFAVVLALAETPNDHDTELFPPYARVEFGGVAEAGAWAVHFEGGRALLLRWDAALPGWAWAADLDAPLRPEEGAEGGAFAVWVRCLRGRIGVSMDEGRSYTWHGDDTLPAFVPAGPVTFRGQGREAGFGLEPLGMEEGLYTSPPQDSLKSRLVATPSFDAAAWEPGGSGGGVAFADLSDPFNRVARYAATLTPGVSTAGAGTFHHSPVVAAVLFRYPVTQAVSAEDPEEPFAGRIVSAEVVKGTELADVSCTLRVRLAAGAAFPGGSWRRRKIRVRIGWLGPDGEYWPDDPAFTGYVDRAPRLVGWDGFGRGEWELHAEGAASRWRHVEWWPGDAFPLGGRSLNDAADLVLETEGIAGMNLPLYREWHALGDAFLLPFGLPEEPAELLRPRERKSETLDRLFGYAGMEWGADDRGVLFSLPRFPDGGPATTGVTHAFDAAETADLGLAIQGFEEETEFGDSGTAVMVTGTLPDGTPYRAWAVDTAAETDAGSPRFCPWREAGPGGQEDLPGTVSPGMVLLRAQALARERFPLPRWGSLEGFLGLEVGRRDVVTVAGAGPAGVEEEAEYVVLSLRHRAAVNEDGSGSMESSFGLWRRE